MKKIFALLTFLAMASLANAQSNIADWAHADPVSTIAVSKAEKDGTFKVNVTITDKVSSKVLASPVLLIGASGGIIETGTTEAVLYHMSVKVNSDGKSATYKSQVIRAGKQEPEQTGTVVVAGA